MVPGGSAGSVRPPEDEGLWFLWAGRRTRRDVCPSPAALCPAWPEPLLAPPGHAHGRPPRGRPCSSLLLAQVKCYHKKCRSTTRDVVFRLQFHTGAVQGCSLVLGKEDLDSACDGEGPPVPAVRGAPAPCRRDPMGRVAARDSGPSRGHVLETRAAAVSALGVCRRGR